MHDEHFFPELPLNTPPAQSAGRVGGRVGKRQKPEPLSVKEVGKLIRDGAPGEYIVGIADGLYIVVTGPETGWWMQRYRWLPVDEHGKPMLRPDGKRKEERPEISLGAYHDLTLAEARAKAIDNGRLIRQGIRLLGARDRRLAEKLKTVGPKALKINEVVTAFTEKVEKEWSENSRRGLKYRVDKYILPEFGDQPMSALSGTEKNIEKAVAIVHRILHQPDRGSGRPIWLAIPVQAEALRRELSQIWKYAKARGWVSGENPVDVLRPALDEQPKSKKHPGLSYRQIPEFMQCLHAYQETRHWQRFDYKAIRTRLAAGMTINSVAKEAGVSYQTIQRICVERGAVLRGIDYSWIKSQALELLLLIGAPRENELLLTLWKEYDERNQCLVFPRARMKVKDRSYDFEIPLSPQASKVINRMRAIRHANSDYIFPGEGKRGRTIRTHLVDIRPIDPTAQGRPMEGASIWRFCRENLTEFLTPDLRNTPFTPHGFRTSFEDWGRAAGYDMTLIRMAHDHPIGDLPIDRHYTGDALTEQRRGMMQEWCNYCYGGPGPKIRTVAEVISLPAWQAKSEVA